MSLAVTDSDVEASHGDELSSTLTIDYQEESTTRRRTASDRVSRENTEGAALTRVSFVIIYLSCTTRMSNAFNPAKTSYGDRICTNTVAESSSFEDGPPSEIINNLNVQV